jgi:hypothetical protein
VIAGSEGELAREDQGAKGNLAGGVVQVGVDQRRWNGDDLTRRWWSSTMVVVFQRAGDWRGVGVWSWSCAGVMCVAEPTRIIPAQVRESAPAGFNVLQTV